MEYHAIYTPFQIFKTLNMQGGYTYPVQDAIGTLVAKCTLNIPPSNGYKHDPIVGVADGAK